MASMKERLSEELKTAMKSRETQRVNCIRMLRSKLMEKEVAMRGKHGRDHELSDEEALEAVQTYAKQRRDSIDAYTAACRQEMADQERAELAIIEEFLPEQLSAEELRAIVKQAVEQSGATSARDMGAVMKLVMPEVKGRADGKQVNAIVRELLAG